MNQTPAPVLANVFVALFAAFFVFYGLGFAFFPQALFLQLTDFALEAGSQTIDIRATYGGLSVAFGIVMLKVWRMPGGLKLALSFIIVSMLAMATGRLIGMLIDGDSNLMMKLYLSLEIGSALVAFGFLRSLKI